MSSSFVPLEAKLVGRLDKERDTKPSGGIKETYTSVSHTHLSESPEGRSLPFFTVTMEDLVIDSDEMKPGLSFSIYKLLKEHIKRME